MVHEFRLCAHILMLSIGVLDVSHAPVRLYQNNQVSYSHYWRCLLPLDSFSPKLENLSFLFPHIYHIQKQEVLTPETMRSEMEPSKFDIRPNPLLIAPGEDDGHTRCGTMHTKTTDLDDPFLKWHLEHEASTAGLIDDTSSCIKWHISDQVDCLVCSDFLSPSTPICDM